MKTGLKRQRICLVLLFAAWGLASAIEAPASRRDKPSTTSLPSDTDTHTTAPTLKETAPNVPSSGQATGDDSATTSGSGTTAAQRPSSSTSPTRPRIELVFLLDTTSSMSAAIEGAKRRIWSIASEFINAQPQPDLRIGAVAFRDQGDAYVTRVKDLTADFDALYTFLFELQAQGGGDLPEDVHAGLEAALEQISWTPRADAAASAENSESSDDTPTRSGDVVRTVFLVGDAPPHFYANRREYKELAGLAVDRGIVINTLVCGHNRDTIKIWEDIARLAHGQSGSVSNEALRADASATAAGSSPYDERIRELSESLDKTRFFVGEKAADAAASLASAKAALLSSGPAVYAARATTSLERAYTNEFANDIVEEIDSGVAGLEDYELSAEQRVEVQSRLKSRRDVQVELADLAAQRRKHLRAELIDKKREGPVGWSSTVSDWVFGQAKAEGVALERVTTHDEL